LRPASAQKCGGTIIIQTAQLHTFEFIQIIIFVNLRFVGPCIFTHSNESTTRCRN